MAKLKKKGKKILKNVLGAGIFSLGIFFGVLIINGLLAIFPTFAGWTMVTIGVIGLTIMGYLGYKNLLS